MPNYKTGLYEAEPDRMPEPPYRARGWKSYLQSYSVIARSSHEASRAARSLHYMTSILGVEHLPRARLKVMYVPEIMITAPTRIAAQRALGLIAAAATLRSADFHETNLAIPEQENALEDLHQHTIDSRCRECTSGYAQAAAIAAKTTNREKWKLALIRYWLSLRSCSVPTQEFDPRYGTRFGIEKDPTDRAIMAQAIVSAYSCIEELGLEVRASQTNPAMINEKWNPSVLADLEERLRSAHVDLAEDFDWAVRSSPTRIEKKKRLPKGKRSSWSKGMVRDREIPVVDAINYASFLRSKVSTHASNKLTRSLTMVDVMNVQHLSRRLLLETLGYWGKL